MWRDAVRELRARACRTYERRRLGSRSLVLISNNCWGYELYRSLGREYATPFVGLYVYPECYLRILRNKFPDRLTLHEFGHRSRYLPQPASHPIGYLEDGEEVHFLHYRSIDEAREKWHRRLQRMRASLQLRDTRLAIKMCDRDGCQEVDLAEFHQLPFATKLSLGVAPHGAQNHIAVPDLREHDAPWVVDGARLYKHRYRYFDITEWLIAGRARHTLFSRSLRPIS